MFNGLFQYDETSPSCSTSLFGCSRAHGRLCSDRDEAADAKGEEETLRLAEDGLLPTREAQRAAWESLSDEISPAKERLPISPGGSSSGSTDSNSCSASGSIRPTEAAPAVEADAATESESERTLPSAAAAPPPDPKAKHSWRHHHSSHHLRTTDLQLSKALSRNLGLLVDGPATPTNATKSLESMKAAPTQAPFWLLPAISRGLKAFRSKMMTVGSPSEQDRLRGVHIHEVYDFYTFADKKVRLRKMQSGVFHHRPSVASYVEDDDAEDNMTLSISAGSTGSYDGDEQLVSPLPSDEPEGEQPVRRKSVRAATPRQDAEGDQPVRRKSRRTSTVIRQGVVSPRGDCSETARWQDVHEDQPGLRLTRARSMRRPEIVSRWGVLTGKLLHAKVLDFTSLSDKAIRRKRIQGCGSPKKGIVFESVRRRAQVVARQAWHLAKRVANEDHDTLDGDWKETDSLVQVFSKDYVDTLALFANTATKILRVQPTLVEATAPCRIFGDIHGQFRDLLLLFRAFGSPDERGAPNFVFNGDFVDRGAHSLEVIGLLLALKVLLPEKVWLIRGNHEDRGMNQKYGFADECNDRLGPEFGPKLFELFHKAFDQLPLGCVVAGRVLVVHGGIGDGAWQLRDVKGLKRPLGEQELNSPELYWACNMLWSDPVEDDDDREHGTFGVHESPRGGRGALFGWDVTKTFCARHGLGLIVRSHQSKQDSMGIDIMHENHLIRVFSARDYEGHGNDGAVLFIEWGGGEDNSSSKKEPILTVRPQILRSATKARIEQAARESLTYRDDGPLSPRMRRRLKGRRASETASMRPMRSGG